VTSKLQQNRDLTLKWKMNVIFRKQENIVFNEVDLCTFSYQPKYSRKQITDLDVLGILLDPDLYMRYCVAECKNVQEKAMEYLLKLQGTMKFFNAEKAYFVQRKIDVNAREVGKDMGIYCLDENNLDYLLKSFGISDPEFQKLEEELYNTRRRLVIEASAFHTKAVNYFRYDFWILPDHRNVVNLIRLLNSCAEKIKGPIEEGKKFIIYELTLLLLLSVLRIASSVLRINCQEVVEGTKTLIMGGTRERRDREALFDEISKIIKENSLQPYPSFLGDLTELLNRYLTSLQFSYESPRCLDLMINCLCCKKTQDIWGKPRDIFKEEVIKFARDIIYFVIGQTGITKDVYSDILSNF